MALAASVALVGAGLGVSALTGMVGARAMPRLAAMGSRLLGVPLQVGGMSVGLGPDATSLVVRLRQAVLGERQAPWATAEEIGVTLALAAPLSGEALVREVRVTRPDVDLVGRSLSLLLGSRGARAQILAALDAERLAVTEGRILLSGPNGATVAVTDFSGGAEYDGDAMRLAFTGRIAEGVLEVTGRAGRATADVSLTFGGRGLDTAALPLIGARLRGTMEFRLDVSAAGDGLRADGRAAVRDGRLVGESPTRLLALSADERRALGALDPALAGSDLVFDEARAVFAWRHGAWRLPRVFVTRRGIVAGGRGRIGVSGDVSGHGTVRIPADVVAALHAEAPLLGRFGDASGTATLPFTIAGPLAAPALTVGRP